MNTYEVVRKYFGLYYNIRWNIAKELGLTEPADAHLPSIEAEKLFFKRAREQGKLIALLAKIKAAQNV